jgi:SAM-dependent methyltransferase
MKALINKFLAKTGLLSIWFRIREAAKAREIQKHDAQYLGTTAPDGWPIPPAKLIVLVGGDTSVPQFLEGSKQGAQIIRDILKKNGLSMDSFQAILDFGCGCGRLVRQWSSLKNTAIHGTDYNTKTIKWCKENLPFARFETNQLLPPTSYADDSFDFVYAISVFTHLSETHQLRWMAELKRILKPGGYFLLTTHGENFRDAMREEEKIAFAAGHLVVRNEEAEGMNLCAAFHPEKYVREELSEGFTVIDFIPAAAKQDGYLLRKPAYTES